MAQLTASRTLVKSSPELWAECSDAAALARHLGAFGEIHITKLEPETAVAWEGEEVRGTVTLEPSGWGTRVVLTAEVPTPTPTVGVGEPDGNVPVPAALEPIGEPDPVVGFEPEVTADAEPVSAPEADLAPAADADSVSAAEPARPGFLRRLFGRWRRSAEPDSDRIPEPDEDDLELNDDDTILTPAVHATLVTPEPVIPTEPVASAEADSPSAQALVGALDSLGRAHRRPFSHG